MSNEILNNISQQAKLFSLSTDMNTLMKDNIPMYKDRCITPFVASVHCGEDVCSYNEKKHWVQFEEYRTECARLKSFNTWPTEKKQTPKQLAQAGFFYTGTGDIVKCFNCGVGISEWDDVDDPWEQHALFTDKCRFLMCMKGAEYIKITKEKLEKLNGGENIKDEMYGPKVNDKICKICRTAEYDTVFKPCTHLIACEKCATDLYECPLCQTLIVDKEHINYS